MSIGNNGGRPSKFTPEVREKLINYIKRRAPYKMAAYASGITDRIFYMWLCKGMDESDAGLDTDFTQFFHTIKSIELDRVLEHTDNISTRPERWQADAWLLERRWREHFAADSFEQEIRNRLEKLEAAQRMKEGAQSNGDNHSGKTEANTE